MTSPSPSPAVEPITCQSWCRDRDGHPTERVREDQWCFGAEHRVHLSTEPSVLMSNGETVPTYLTTYLLRQADDTAPRVFVGYDEGSGKPATLDEARQFAVEILAQVDENEIRPSPDTTVPGRASTPAEARQVQGPRLAFAAPAEA